jgi:hypothetical protein
VWVQLSLDYPCFARRINDYFCRAYQVADTVWRWEVWWIRRSLPDDSAVQMVRTGTRPSRAKAMDAAEEHVRVAGGTGPA